MNIMSQRGLRIAGAFVAGLIATAAHASTPVTTGTPVTFTYDSGTFTSSPRAASARFGTHFTATLLWSNDLTDYFAPQGVLQHLNTVATLQNYSITSGEFTLTPLNSTIVADVTSYFSASTGVPIVQLSFAATATTLGIPLSITARSGLNQVAGIGVNPTYTCGPYNHVCGTLYTNFNLGGGSFTKVLTPAGPAGGGETGAVPEPASWAMMVSGFGLMGAAMRRRKTSLVFG